LITRGGHDVEVERNNKSLLCTMKYLSDITETHIDIIGQAMHDTLPEYDYDKVLQLRVYRISQTLSENPSIYQLSSEDLDCVCMCLNDCLYVLDDLMRDLGDLDLRDCRVYRENIEDILSLLQRSN
jgi:hypothetical protein